MKSYYGGNEMYIIFIVMFNYNMFYIYGIDFYWYVWNLKVVNRYICIYRNWCLWEKKIFNCFIFKILVFIIL